MTISAFQKDQSFHERRIKGIGGSEVAAIMGISPYMSAYKLWRQKTKRDKPDDLSGLPHIQRGVLGEEVCRMLLERAELKTYKPKYWQGLKPHHLCSDDGFQVDDNVILEIKCMGRENHEKAGKGIVPPYYMVQCQWNLFVSKATKCIFISFRPEEEEMHKVDVLPDPKQQAEIEAAVDHFWLNNVLKDEAPPMTDLDYIEVKDKTLDELLHAYGKATLAIKEHEAVVEHTKKMLKAFVATHPQVKNREGFKLVRSEVKGGIDYKRLVEDKGYTTEELKAYEKKPVSKFVIRLPELWVSGD